MIALLELRDKIKIFLAKNEPFILPVLKFLLAFTALLLVNSNLGYMTKINNVAVVLIVALMCSFLPVNCMIVFGALFSVLHMYALSMEIAVFGLIVYLLLFCLYFRFAPKDSLVVMLTPLLFFLKIPYVMPLAMGLLGTPVSVVSVSCGVVVYYLLLAVSTSAQAINTINTVNAADATTKLRLVIDAVLGNKAMMVTIVAFSITVIVVYLVRRMSVDYSWTIAMIAGVILNMVILLVGDLVYETNISVVGAILGNILAFGIAKVVEFFRFCVDYSRTEKVQFEDDEYYYYVKAVPKMTVAAPTKTVKHINIPRRAPEGNGRNGGGRRSVTIGRQNDATDDDYEELF